MGGLIIAENYFPVEGVPRNEPLKEDFTLHHQKQKFPWKTSERKLILPVGRVQLKNRIVKNFLNQADIMVKVQYIS